MAEKYIEAQKLRMQKSRVKKMLTEFFYVKGIIHHEFVPEKQTVNGKFHKEDSPYSPDLEPDDFSHSLN
jgi:hypothetical protein